ncbi:hypothetical protein SOMG_01212 [Schizosaccharomyces osmophilus]|uniref:Secreted protein n=1 Tax=Schizosaccharomyces osmophilus TaxID=2545709 RepID=A0AAE9WBJ4_9SCHI|nr:uncharacterized protein SOMG_01212 [Schizosaccharomyces osmophilus]WBW71618.1 hypothetical protein SOMG_01212 [Schizosaccharomyces osmophilus]
MAVRWWWWCWCCFSALPLCLLGLSSTPKRSQPLPPSQPLRFASPPTTQPKPHRSQTPAQTPDEHRICFNTEPVSTLLSFLVFCPPSSSSSPHLTPIYTPSSPI